MKRGRLPIQLSFLLVFSLVLIIVAGCVPERKTAPSPVSTKNISKIGPVCPAICNDNDACTTDVCNEQTDYECRSVPIAPCCGNSLCETGETDSSCPLDCKPQLSKEIQEMIASNSKIKSYKYDYSDPTISLTFSIKGNLTKISYLEPYYYGSFQYDTALLDDAKKTAKIYCSKYCTPNGVMDWSYDFFKKETPLESIKAVKSAKILRYENLESDKSTTVIEVSRGTGKEIMWLWTFYGVPIYREFYDGNNKTGYIRYQSMRVNTVSDDEFVIPSAVG